MRVKRQPVTLKIENLLKFVADWHYLQRITGKEVKMTDDLCRMFPEQFKQHNYLSFKLDSVVLNYSRCIWLGVVLGKKSQRIFFEDVKISEYKGFLKCSQIEIIPGFHVNSLCTVRKLALNFHNNNLEIFENI